jgi:hypothetical protein
MYAHDYSFCSRSHGMFNELEYSIKSVRKFYRGARCFVVGDAPDSIDAIKIHHAVTETVPGHMDRTEVDLIEKLKLIIADPRINEQFVLMYDDQFFLQKITKVDLRPTALCKIDNLAEYYQGKRIFGLLYGRLWKNTYDHIMQSTPNVYDWETHLPKLLEKKNLSWLIDVFDLEHQNLLITSLYYTHFAKSVRLLENDDTIRSHTWTIDGGMDWDKVFSRKFLIIDDNSCVPDMWNRIKAVVD